MARIKTNDAFSSSIKKITEIYYEYKLEDVIESLLVSDIWLPNLSSPVQHQFLYSALLSLNSSNFQESISILSYNDFQTFLNKIYPLIPSFDSLEDYVPSADWGEVKFYFNKKLYNIFYGTEFENIYDYLIVFETLFSSLDTEYVKISERSPASELRTALYLQDFIISKINNQLNNIDSSKISPGHKEIPPKAFWENVKKLILDFKTNVAIEDNFLNNFSITVGNLDINSLDYASFCGLVFNGELIPYFLIAFNNSYYPFLPRRISSVLYDSWAKVFINKYQDIKREISYRTHLDIEIFRYLKDRLDNEKIFSFVSPVKKEGVPQDVVYSLSLISKKYLFLVYVCSPFFSEQQISSELNDINEKIKESLELLKFSPLVLALRGERKNIEYLPNESGEALVPKILIVLPQVTTNILGVEIPKSLNADFISLTHFYAIFDELESNNEIASFFNYIKEYEKEIEFPIVNLLDIFASFKSSHGVLVKGALKYTKIFLDPHWGSSMRFESLSNFWALYPPVELFRHPRSWNIKKETPTRIRLEDRGILGCIIHCKICNTHILITSPLFKMTYEQARISNFIMECVEDNLSRYKEQLKIHTFFHSYKQLLITIFPWDLVENTDYKHVQNLNPYDAYWKSDSGHVDRDIRGVRIVYNRDLLVEEFEGIEDNSIEIELMIEILTQINKFAYDSNFDDIVKELSSYKGLRPKYKLYSIQKEVAFPEIAAVYEPTLYHFKKANKLIAKFAAENNVLPGSYRLASAKRKLNFLRRSIVKEIDTYIQKFSYIKCIPYLLTYA